MRPFVVAANWKMNKTPRETVEFFKSFNQEAKPAAGTEVVFFPPAFSLWVTQQALNNTSFSFGAQNVHFEASGAFTGENSPVVAREIGARFALVGHSERRQLFGETDELLAKKVRACLKAGLIPMLCVGETLEERNSGRTLEVVKQQLSRGLDGVSATEKVYVAYEPVWAIGTGQVATPAQAEEVHAAVRQHLREVVSGAFADACPLLYGGSVKPDNASELKSQSNIDGFLVGGASLQVASFSALCS